MGRVKSVPEPRTKSVLTSPRHTQKLTCQAITINGKLCMNYRSKDSIFCCRHGKAATNSTNSTSSWITCKATIGTGTRGCSKPAQVNSVLCSKHIRHNTTEIALAFPFQMLDDKYNKSEQSDLCSAATMWRQTNKKQYDENLVVPIQNPCLLKESTLKIIDPCLLKHNTRKIVEFSPLEENIVSIQDSDLLEANFTVPIQYRCLLKDNIIAIPDNLYEEGHDSERVSLTRTEIDNLFYAGQKYNLFDVDYVRELYHEI